MGKTLRDCFSSVNLSSVLYQAEHRANQDEGAPVSLFICIPSICRSAGNASNMAFEGT